jgi:hypothetical protein
MMLLNSKSPFDIPGPTYEPGIPVKDPDAKNWGKMSLYGAKTGIAGTGWENEVLYVEFMSLLADIIITNEKDPAQQGELAGMARNRFYFEPPNTSDSPEAQTQKFLQDNFMSFSGMTLGDSIKAPMNSQNPI